MKYLHQTYQQHAPELLGNYWFNSEPLFIRELQGQPVVLFFWDYTSLQSMRLVPFINGLYSLYTEYGVVCAGIHSSEFSFARDPVRIEQAIKKNLIFFPVLTDHQRLVTDAYRISAFPSVCLVDHKGDIYDTLTEVLIPERIERSVQHLLRQSGYRGELPILLNPERDQRYEPAQGSLREMYTGYAHGALGNPEGYSPELPAGYSDPGEYLDRKFYAQGIWLAERNAFTFAGEQKEGYVICRSEKTDIDILIGSSAKTSVQVHVDNSSVPVPLMGDDVKKDKQGNTFITVDEPRRISILKNTTGDHMVKFTPMIPGVSFYMLAFTRRPGDEESGHDSSIRKN